MNITFHFSYLQINERIFCKRIKKINIEFIFLIYFLFYQALVLLNELQDHLKNF